MRGTYTSQLGAGLGMVEETGVLLDLWQPGTDAKNLFQVALQSGRFPRMSARRLRNLVAECFAPRYLRDDGEPASLLKALKGILSAQEWEQLLFLYTCRANAILADFVREVYWGAYTAGQEAISNEEGRVFVLQAIQDGKTTTAWSDSMIRNVSGYLTGCCGEFGLLERGQRRTRKILHYRIESRIAALLAYDLHLAGHGDNLVVGHPDWGLFGMDRADVVDELKRLALKGLLIVQTAGGVTRIGWQYKDRKELIDVFAHS